MSTIMLGVRRQLSTRYLKASFLIQSSVGLDCSAIRINHPKGRYCRPLNHDCLKADGSRSFSFISTQLPHRLLNLNAQCRALSDSIKVPDAPIKSDPAKPDVIETDAEEVWKQHKLSEEDELMVAKLAEYKDKYGDCHLPASKKATAIREREELGIDEALAQWIVKQRSFYKLKSKQNDPAFRMKAMVLELMGFVWTENDAAWFRNFNRLRTFVKENDGRVEVTRAESGPLAHFIDNQRKAYKAERLSEERKKLLTDLGMLLDPYEERWWSFYDKLCEYRDVHGHPHFPLSNEQDPALASWVSRQRRVYQDKKMSADRINAMEGVGFSWNYFHDSWEENYQRLCEFYEEHGHTRVPRTQKDELGFWVSRQRSKFRDFIKKQAENQGEDENQETDRKKCSALGRLGFEWGSVGDGDGEQLSQLRDLPFPIDVYEERWQDYFRQLVEFKDKHGHLAVPRGSDDYQELAHWVRRQRGTKSKAAMAKDRIEALEDIGFAWNFKEERWDQMHSQLVKFHGEHGHIDVTVENAALKRWLVLQKRFFESNMDSLDEVQKANYEALKKLGLSVEPPEHQSPASSDSLLT